MFAAILTAAVVGHTPVFPGGSHHALEAEPSQAWYFGRDVHATISVRYDEGSPMYTVVYAPETTPVTANISVTMDDNCTVGTEKITGNSHIQDHAIGDVIYEPFGETTLRVMAVVHSGVRSPVDQTCTYVLSDNSHTPLVWVVGTEEKNLESMLIGLPIVLMQIAVRFDRYVYGYYLITTLVVVAAIVRQRERWYMPLISVVFTATAVNRFSLSTSPGWGLALTAIPLGLALVIYTRRRWAMAVIWVVALITPTRSWIDVALLLLAYVYEWRQPAQSYSL